MGKEKITPMIKFTHAYDGKRDYCDLVDGLLIKLSEVSRNGSTVRYRVEAAVAYEKELKNYLLVTTAGLSEEGSSKGYLCFDFFTGDLIPKNISGIPAAVEDHLPGKVKVIYEVDTRLGPGELENPVNLAPRVADLVLFYRGLNVEDYKILLTQWKDLPADPRIPHDKIPGFKMLEIDLEAKLAGAKTSLETF